ncbi:MAG: CoA ester lyase [Candidatus Izemoplasmatales bacterium]
MRTVCLFVPGNNPAMLQNADVFGADAVILDLEDAVAVAEKDAARELLKEYLKTWDFGKLEVMVRVNSLASGWLEADLEAVVCEKLAAIVYPKAAVEVLYDVDDLLSRVETRKGLERKIGIVPIVETAQGVVETDDLVYMPRIEGVLLGAEDLAADMEFERTKEGAELAYPRARVAFACRSEEIASIDTPFTDVNDEIGLERDARTAKSLGFTGKAVIHPNQIETVRRVFAPTEAEIRWATRILSAAKEADRKGLGAFSLDGRMVDRPIVVRAEKILLRAGVEKP